jgi:triosephosphate isomerase
MGVKIVAANWKLNKNPKEAADFCNELKQKASGTGPQLVIFPPALVAWNVAQIQGPYSWGLQNSYFEAQGAFTGENSVAVAKDMGASWVLIGHSERRTLFAETDSDTAKKIKAVWSQGLSAMLCIGETLSEREAGQTLQVLKKQLQSSLQSWKEDIKPASFLKTPLCIAYEPVWAIGTGKVATSAQVQDCHAAIAGFLSELGFNSSLPILYGGSVKPENASELSSLPHVSGFLVGGASLKVDSFLAIAAGVKN